MNIANKIKIFYQMLPRARKYGIRYLLSKDYRRKCKNREVHLRDRKKYKSFVGNKKSIKIALFRRDGNKCFWCYQVMTFSEATIDHKVPVSEGTNNSKTNLRLIHNECRITRDRAIAKGILKLDN